MDGLRVNGHIFTYIRLTGLILSEVRKREIPYMQNLKRNYTNELIYKKKKQLTETSHRFQKNIYGYQVENMGGRVYKLGTWDSYTHYYI